MFAIITASQISWGALAPSISAPGQEITKIAIYCPQGSGTLRQQLLSMHGIAWYCMVLHGIAW